MEFKNIVEARYATKLFSGERVPEETIDELLELIRLAPSSFGLQPFSVHIITDAALKEKLRAAAWNQPQITTCSHLLVFCAKPQVAQRIEQYGKLMREHAVPDVNVEQYTTMMKDSLLSRSSEELLAWSQRQLYIALSNALNGAKALGFDSCPMEGFDRDQFAEILGLADEVPTVLCPIGVAADKPRPKMRFDDLFVRET